MDSSQPIDGRTVFDIPMSVAVCPHCGGPLILDVQEYEIESRAPTEAGCYVDCPTGNKESDDRHYDMPYVYWLPVQQRVAAWARAHVRIDL